MDHAHRLATADLMAALPKLRRYARVLMGGQDGADRLVVETLAGAWHGQRRQPGDLDLRAWLFGLMHATHWRNLPQRTAPSPPAAPASGGGASGDMCSQLLLLPVEEREVLLLVAVERLSYSDIADLLDVPVATVLSTLARARQRLCAIGRD